MKLTRKCKEEFLKWHRNRLSVMTHSELLNINDETVYNALIIEFLDSVRLYIGVHPNMYNKFLFFINKKDTYKQWRNDSYYFTRTEATNESILKANEIYNNI